MVRIMRHLSSLCKQNYGDKVNRDGPGNVRDKCRLVPGGCHPDFISDLDRSKVTDQKAGVWFCEGIGGFLPSD